MVFDVVAIGNINVDLLFYMERLPGRDREALSRDFVLSHGGSAANFAYTAGRLGLATAIMGCIGEDPLGDDSVEELEGAGVECRWVQRVAGKRTGTVCVLVDGKGGRRMVAYRGANQELLSAIRGGFPRSRFIQLSNVEKPVLEGVLRKKATALVSLDPGGEAERLGLEGLAGVDLLLLNDEECRDLTGMDFRKGADLLASRVGTVVVKLGPRGAYAARGDDRILQPAFRVPVVDTTGAGDAFDAGFICGLASGMGIKTCLCWGQAAAALKIGIKGARSRLQSREEMIGFLKANLDNNAKKILIK